MKIRLKVITAILLLTVCLVLPAAWADGGAGGESTLESPYIETDKALYVQGEPIIAAFIPSANATAYNLAVQSNDTEQRVIYQTQGEITESGVLNAVIPTDEFSTENLEGEYVISVEYSAAGYTPGTGQSDPFRIVIPSTTVTITVDTSEALTPGRPVNFAVTAPGASIVSYYDGKHWAYTGGSTMDGSVTFIAGVHYLTARAYWGSKNYESVEENEWVYAEPVAVQVEPGWEGTSGVLTFDPRGSLGAGEDLDLTIANYDTATDHYLHVQRGEKDGSLTHILTVKAWDAATQTAITRIDGSYFTQTGYYYFNLDTYQECLWTDPYVQGTETLIVCAEELAAPAVSGISGSHTAGTDLTIQVNYPAEARAATLLFGKVNNGVFDMLHILLRTELQSADGNIQLQIPGYLMAEEGTYRIRTISVSRDSNLVADSAITDCDITVSESNAPECPEAQLSETEGMYDPVNGTSVALMISGAEAIAYSWERYSLVEDRLVDSGAWLPTGVEGARITLNFAEPGRYRIYYSARFNGIWSGTEGPAAFTVKLAGDPDMPMVYWENNLAASNLSFRAYSWKSKVLTVILGNCTAMECRVYDWEAEAGSDPVWFETGTSPYGAFEFDVDDMYLGEGTYRMEFCPTGDGWNGSHTRIIKLFILSEKTGEWDYFVDYGEFETLYLTGSGTIPEYASGYWDSEIYEGIGQIVVGEGITGIGPYVFANMPGKIRVDFLGSTMPQIDPTAFSGTDVIFRYYTGDSWPTGDNWFCLPVRNTHELFYSSGKGWYMFDDSGSAVSISAALAREETFSRRSVHLFDIPAADFESICLDWKIIDSISFEEGCAGNVTLDIPGEYRWRNVSCYSDGMTLTINARGRLMDLFVTAGNVACFGDMNTLQLRTRQGESAQSENTVVIIEGTVDRLQLSEMDLSDPFLGTLRLKGKISDGFLYGSAWVEIPLIEANVQFDGVAVGNLCINTGNDTVTVIENGALCLASTNVQPEDLYGFAYTFDGEQWSVSLTPKYGVATPNIPQGSATLADYEPDFDENYIYYSADTDVSIYNTARTIMMSGEVRNLAASHSSVLVNGPVGELEVTEYADITINNAVRYASIRDYPGNSITIGADGVVNSGVVERIFNRTQRFGRITGPKDLYSNNQLHVLSRKFNDGMAAILPSDTAVSEAAGEGIHATLDMDELSIGTLSPEELEALSTEINDEAPEITGVVDLYVTEFTLDEGGNAIQGGRIEQLNSPVEITLEAEPDASIVRLHEENDRIQAELLESTSGQGTITFMTDKFSRYVLVSDTTDPEEDWPGWTLGQNTEDYGEWILHISGSGEMPDYPTPLKAPWASPAAQVQNIRIVIDADITYIGSNTFGDLNGISRVDFLNDTMPEVAEDAFSGSNVICRYYSEDPSWTAGTDGRTDAVWLYLPYYEAETPGRLPLDYGELDGSTTPCWHSGDYRLSIDQAKELSYKNPQVFLYAVPIGTDKAVYEDRGLPIYMYISDCEAGEIELTAEHGGNNLQILEMNCPDVRVTVDHSGAAESAFQIRVGDGILDYTGDVGQLILRNSDGINSGDVTINGDVAELSFYNEDTGNEAYDGDLEVTGTIGNGFEYGKGTMDIPGIGEEIPMGSSQVRAFANLTRTAQDGKIIEDGEFMIADIPGVSRDIGDYRLEYSFVDDTDDEFDRITLELTPAAGGTGTEINILDIKPTFTPNDIYWEANPDVNIHGWDPDTPKHLTFGNGTGSSGINVLFINSSVGSVTVNCPVNEIQIWQGADRDNALTMDINNTVSRGVILSLRGNANIIRMGENGLLAGSNNWLKYMCSPRSFATVRGACTLVQDGQLCVLSAKAGESLQSIMPGDTPLSTYAGMSAVMEISEADSQELDNDEQEALETVLGVADTVDTVFDVTVTGFTAGSETGTEIHALSGEVRMAVENTTGGEAYVARLHEDNSTVTATAVSEPTTDGIIWFGSDLFSKYVIISKGEPFDPSTLNTLILPNMLEEIEANAFEGGAFEAVIIPDNCTRIGTGAFKGCRNLIYVSYPTGITIEEGAFDNWDILIKDER